MDNTLAHLCGAAGSAAPVVSASKPRPKISLQWVRCIPFFVLLAAVSTLTGFWVGRFNSNWGTPSGPSQAFLLAATDKSSASNAQPKDSDIEDVASLAPQQQAERLLELAIRKPDPSLDLIGRNLESWRGHLESDDRLFHLVLAALKADDPRVRTAAVEIDLAANHLEKSPQSLVRLTHQIQGATDGRFMALWRLGALGNRGVEPAIVFSTLLHYSRDANQQTRFWAAEGLAMLGTDETIDPLLGMLAHDPAAKVRESAACALARTGLLTGEQRLTAVPQLLNLLDDDSLDSTTQDLVYSALQTITGAAFGRDPGAWREWWAHHDRAAKRRPIPRGLLVA